MDVDETDSQQAESNPNTSTSLTAQDDQSGVTGRRTKTSNSDPVEQATSAASTFFRNRSEGATQGVLAVSIIGALISGYFLQWTIESLVGSAILFIIFALASWIAIVRQQTATEALSVFFYAMATAGILAPILFFVEIISRLQGATGFEALGTGVGIVTIFPTLSLIHIHLAIGFTVIGYAVGRFAQP